MSALAETITVVEAIVRESLKSRDFDETVTVTDEASKIKSYFLRILAVLVE